MKALVTGANGFVGRLLVRRLLIARPDISRIICVDPAASHLPSDPKVVQEPVFQDALRESPDLVFHLAAIPGGRAEERFEAGLEVNLMLTIRLLEALRLQGNVRRLVYTSTIGVFGALDQPVDDDTPPHPTWSYGTHKTIGELLIADYTRKGFIDGRTIRLPAVVARGPESNGAISAFMSDLIRLAGAGEKFECPVSPQATCWWMSRRCAVDNLLHAAAAPADAFPPERVFTMPGLWCSMESIVDGVVRVTGRDARSLVSYRPIPEVEKRYGSNPPLDVPRAEAAGFRSDGDVDSLVRSALAAPVEQDHAE